MTSDTDLAALISTRICHDLVNPLGAIANGIELLQMVASTTGPEMELIEQSVQAATGRIEVFRLAFGASAPDQQVRPSQHATVLAALSADKRITYDWPYPDPLPRPLVQRLLLAAMCLATALPHGGQIEIGQTGARWHAMATGPNILWAADLWEGLGSAAFSADLKASDIQFALLAAHLRRADLAIEITRSETQINVLI